jgi:hypothetical protein
MTIAGSINIKLAPWYNMDKKRGGRTHNNNALHVVCSVGQDYVWMITTYYPDGDKWIEGFRERRR